MSSQAEREMREAVVARLRVLKPRARIVHELNIAGTGSNRIDVAAIGPDYIIGVEIKSERDTLSRLDDQWNAFRRVCDVVIVAAHRKHFEPWRWVGQRDDVPAALSLKHSLSSKHLFRRCVWCYPHDPELRLREHHKNTWELELWRSEKPRPKHPSELLEMLWHAELKAVCAAHRFSFGSRTPRGPMIYDLAMGLTQREIKRAVCGQLRRREFAEADPVVEREAAE